jgi:hypothetical protein
MVELSVRSPSPKALGSANPLLPEGQFHAMILPKADKCRKGIP